MEHTKTFREQLVSVIFSYRREALLVVAMLVVSGLSIGGYFFYKDYVARQGHKAYAAALAVLEAPVLKEGEGHGAFNRVFTSAHEKWRAVSEAFGAVYKKYSMVGIGVMAGAAQVQALLHLKEYKEARKLLADVVVHIASPQLRSLYTLMQARLFIDSEEAGEPEKGVALLAQLASTKDSAVHDSALYYLGLHYWLAHDFTSAANYWQQLLVQYDGLESKSSPWVAPVREKLALIEQARDKA